MTARAAIVLAALLPAALGAARSARADDDGYCQRVKGVAAADAALGLSPAVFGSVGYVEAPATTAAPDPTANDTRVTVGVSYRFTGAVEGLVTRARADADCRRHEAEVAIGDAARAQALAARAEVLDAALTETDQLLARTRADVAARRATAPELTALELRVADLQALAAATTAERGRLPAGDRAPVPRALARLQAADAEVERREASLRVLRAFDLSARVGYDSLAGQDDDSPYFAVVSASVNLGVLWQLVGNRDAAAGRRRMLERAPAGAGNRARLEAELADERSRAASTAALVDELDRQYRELKSLGGDASRRIAQTVWFDLVRMRAEHAYLAAHVAALATIVGEAGP
ncbi:MAG: hypothetical protein JNK64_02830 [Myxococcales bacterium]|nr:hypothetical protein [Myxococcales bacterium]